MSFSKFLFQAFIEDSFGINHEVNRDRSKKAESDNGTFYVLQNCKACFSGFHLNFLFHEIIQNEAKFSRNLSAQQQYFLKLMVHHFNRVSCWCRRVFEPHLSPDSAIVFYPHQCYLKCYYRITKCLAVLDILMQFKKNGLSSKCFRESNRDPLQNQFL